MNPSLTPNQADPDAAGSASSVIIAPARAIDPQHAEKLQALETAWADDLKIADRADVTRAKYRDALRRFFRWCDESEILLDEVATKDVCDWRDEMREHYGEATVKQRLAAIRGFYDWLVEKNLVATNPAARVRCTGPASQSLRRDELTDDEMRALLATCDAARDDWRVAQRDKAILYLMAFCGVRTIEVHRASREDLRQKGGRMILNVQGKGHREPDEYVVIPARAEAVLREWLSVHPANAKGPLFVSLSKRSPGNPLTTNYIRRMVKRRMRDCGIDNPAKSTHSLRHSAITRMHRGGATVTAIRDAARHRRLDTTLGYIHEKNRIKDAAEDRVSYDPEE
jgi:site-specific recombinase XerD